MVVIYIDIHCCRLKSVDLGYWFLVKYFTRTEAVNVIDGLVSLKTSMGKGRLSVLCDKDDMLDTLGECKVPIRGPFPSCHNYLLP